MFRKSIPSAVILACVFVAGTARAHIIYSLQFANGSGVPTDSFTVNQGSTVTVALFLSQSDVSGLLTNGLSSATVSVSSSDPGVAVVPDLASVAFNPELDLSYADVTGGLVTLNLIASGYVFPTGNAILLATLTYSGIFPGTTFLEPVAIGDFSDVAVYVNGGGELTPGEVTSRTGDITANELSTVPEPSGLAIWLCIAGTGSFCAWVRRRRKPNAAYFAA